MRGPKVRCSASRGTSGAKRRLDFVVCLAAAAGSLAAGAAWAVQPVFELVELPGLTDAEHSDAQGIHVSLAQSVDGTGLVFGVSQRFLAGATWPNWNGVTGWVYDPSTGVTTRAGLDTVPYAPLDLPCSNGISDTTLLGFALGATSCNDLMSSRHLWAFDSRDRVKTFIGLSGPEYVNPVSGTPIHELLPSGHPRISRSGHIAGYTYRWLPSFGSSAWLYDSTTRQTTRIGLYDAEHTASDGSQASHANLMSGIGNVAGQSERFVPSGLAATNSIWIHRADTGVTRRVGLYDGDGRGSTGFTRADGHQESGLQILTDSAFAAGHSTPFRGSEPFGLVAWRYRIADDSIVTLGLEDAAHTRADGARTSGVSFATDSGHVLGASTRYDGGTDFLGATPWLFDAASQATTSIGLFDAAHTSPDGRHQSTPNDLTESGHAIGTAVRLGIEPSATASQGISTWVARAGVAGATRIGLVDSTTLGAATFTSSEGEQMTTFLALLESGDVIGSSLAYIAERGVGTASWYYEASTGTTRPIGLYGPRFTAPDGSFSCTAFRWTETGFVAGSSFNPSLDPVLWVYSAQTDEVDEIALPGPTPPGVPIFSEILFLTDEGMAVGRFTFYDGAPPNGSTQRYFVWTPDGGAVYLDDRIDAGFEAAGWVAIESIDSVDGGRILGSGRRANGNVDGLMLVPLPEPGLAALLVTGCLAAAAQTNRRRRERLAWPRDLPVPPAV